MKKESWLKAHWKGLLGIVLMLVSVAVLVLSMGVLDGLFVEPVLPENAVLSDFVIVADAENMELANTLSAKIYKDTGLAVYVEAFDEFEGGHAIYVGTRDYNSYGGYKYRITAEANEEYASIYLDGTGVSLRTAMDTLVEDYIENEVTVFPFGMEAVSVGYEWNTKEATMTGLGFKLNATETQELAEGVSLMEMKYKSLAMGKVSAYVVVVKADAKVKMVVSAAEWDETNSVENPAPVYTVEEHGQMLTDKGHQVLAISNAGYFQKAAGSNLPWGMQIVNGVVMQEPNTTTPKYTNNWVGMTKDGKYVISDTEGYQTTYKDNLECAVGGHLVMMKDGVPEIISGTPYYRTAVGVNANGDLVIVQISDANYGAMVQVFMDLDMDITTVLNLDGGGSTTLHAVDDKGKLKRIFCGNGALERPIADAIAFVVDK